jgi:esterase/lipase
MGTIWDLQAALTRRLLRWSAASIVAGAVLLLLPGNPFWRGFGIQALAWGAIDAAIALFGWRAARRRRSAQPDPLAPDIVDREANKLRRLLWINTGLDVLYVAGGLALVLTLGATNAYWRGHGWGIVVQGAFLFAFDLLHATSIPVDVSRGVPPPYGGSEHLAFLWPGGQPAALLVHGYLGSPAEMRPLAKSLRREGWTVQGLLLPGFGADVETLPEREVEEWLSAIVDALRALQREHSPVLLIGHSMGAALSVAAAAKSAATAERSAVAQQPPDGLVLLSPYVYLLSPFWGGAYASLGWLLPRHARLFRWADWNQPGLREWIAFAWPHLDLDDVDNQRAFSQIAVPLSILASLHKSGREARRRARTLTVPTLVLQGAHDHVAWPQYARRLASKWLPRARYVELDGDHWLVYRSRPTWPDVEREVLEFARSLAPHGDTGRPSPAGLQQGKAKMWYN